MDLVAVQQRFRSLMVSGDSINSAPEQVTDEDDHPQGDAPPECVERLGAGPVVESDGKAGLVGRLR